MSQVINTNILSLNAQRNLTNSAATLQTSLQRLSSGLRINSAKDDAAGLAISERFTTQIRGMNQAVRNANDGISLAQVAEGALGEVNNNLQRIRELAVQARNATNSDADREALNREVEQRIGEIQRVATQTEFNGTKLLDGGFASQVFQVGANQGQTISVDSIANSQANALGNWNIGGATLVAPTVEEGGVGAEGTFTWAATKITIKLGDAKPEEFTFPAVTEGVEFTDANAAKDSIAKAVADAINEKFSGMATVVGQTVKLEAFDTLAVTVADEGATSVEADSLSNTPVVGFAAESVLTAPAADRMIVAMDAALTSVNDARAQLGAVQNRFESVVANLSSAVENLSASRSRILDTDFAAETAALTRGQILQQAGTAMLAQANAAPQNVLSLLR